MAYTLSNKCAKNLFKRTVLLQLIITNVVTCFFGTQCRTPEKLNHDHRPRAKVQRKAAIFEIVGAFDHISLQ